MYINQIYFRVLDKLNNDAVLHGEEIEQLQQVHIDRIFANYKNVKNKVRLYNFTINSFIREEHIDIALQYINKSSFIVGGRFSVPFRVSYFERTPNLKNELVLFISFACGTGKAYFKGGVCDIDVIVDMERKELLRMLFPIMMEDKDTYNKITKNFGIRCDVCKGVGKIRGKICYKCKGMSVK